jgi:hypothetical protein
MTHAVLIEVDVSGIDREQGLHGRREGMVPKGLSLTLWATERDAEAMAARFGVGSNPQAGAAIARCEVREVAATAVTRTREAA